MVSAVSLRDYSSQSHIKNNATQSFGRKSAQATTQEAPQKKSHTGLYMLAGLAIAGGLAFAFRKPLMNIKVVSDAVATVTKYASKANNKINKLGGEKLKNFKEASSTALKAGKTFIAEIFNKAQKGVTEFLAKFKKQA